MSKPPVAFSIFLSSSSLTERELQEPLEILIKYFLLNNIKKSRFSLWVLSFPTCHVRNMTLYVMLLNLLQPWISGLLLWFYSSSPTWFFFPEFLSGFEMFLSVSRALLFSCHSDSLCWEVNGAVGGRWKTVKCVVQGLVWAVQREAMYRIRRNLQDLGRKKSLWYAVSS